MRNAQVTVGSDITSILVGIARDRHDDSGAGASANGDLSDDFPIDDISQWVDEDGVLIAPCQEVCAALIGHHAPSVRGRAGAASNCPTDSVETAVDENTGLKRPPHSTDFSSSKPLYGEGRRHACWRSDPFGAGSNAIGKWLARAGASEAARVASFHHLAFELVHLRAPQQLIQRSRRAMADEMLHARMMSSLAERWGGIPETIGLRPFAQRSLFDLALENAEEGCAKEAFAALVATVQARRASDPRIRATLGVISRDELRHTTFAWDLHSWLLSHLGASQAQVVSEHLQCSLTQLADGQASGISASAAQLSVLGLPSREEHIELALQMGIQVRQLQLCA